jgi:pentatricopeptide repeat protein
MYNTALSALGKARQLAPACALFARMQAAGAADAVSHQTLIMAHGMAGDPAGAEAALRGMLSAGHPHCDYAYCGVISAHGMVGNWRAALAVGRRLQEAGLRHCLTVHVYNSMIGERPPFLFGRGALPGATRAAMGSPRPPGSTSEACLAQGLLLPLWPRQAGSGADLPS